MSKFEALDQLVDEGNGFLQTATVLENNISKQTLAKYVETRSMKRAAHGVYMLENAWPDDYYLLYLRNRRVVFSYESALYLHNLIDREPSVTTVSVPKCYNSTHIAKQGVRVIHTKPEWYEIGITRVKTVFGNEVPVYDRERTICDIIRRKDEMDIQIFQYAIKEYLASGGKNIHRLMDYAKKFQIESVVRTYTEILL